MRFPLSIVLFAQFNFSLAFLSKASSIAIVKCGSIVKSPPRSSSSARHATQEDNNDGASNIAATTASNNNNPRRRGLLRRITGDGTPYTFPLRPLTFQKQWPVEMPLQPDDFSRLDPSNDGIFYSLPRLVYHIDEPAVVALTQFYRQGIPANSDILDICSSWVSHYPVEFPSSMGRICATGMNYLELALNDQLTPGDFQVLDLNQIPQLGFDKESFDVVTCAVSIDYLIHPIEVLRECHRVLRPGGKMIISFSNRCFVHKAIRIWRTNRSNVHWELVNGFFHYAGGYDTPQAYEITAKLPQQRYQDPMFVVEATKAATHD